MPPKEKKTLKPKDNISNFKAANLEAAQNESSSKPLVLKQPLRILRGRKAAEGTPGYITGHRLLASPCNLKKIDEADIGKAIGAMGKLDIGDGTKVVGGKKGVRNTDPVVIVPKGFKKKGKQVKEEDYDEIDIKSEGEDTDAISPHLDSYENAAPTLTREQEEQRNCLLQFARNNRWAQSSFLETRPENVAEVKREMRRLASGENEDLFEIFLHMLDLMRRAKELKGAIDEYGEKLKAIGLFWDDGHVIEEEPVSMGDLEDMDDVSD